MTANNQLVREIMETYVQNLVDKNNHSIDALINQIIDLGIEVDMDYVTELYDEYIRSMDDRQILNKNNDQPHNQNHGHMRKLWSKAENEIMPLLISKLSIMIDITINNKKYRALIDTGAETCIMSKKIVEECGLLDHVDQKMKTHISGIEGVAKQTFGYIPYLNISIGNFEAPCPFTIMNEDHIDVILSQAFLTYYKAILDFDKKTLKIDGNQVDMYVYDKGLGSVETF